MRALAALTAAALSVAGAAAADDAVPRSQAVTVIDAKTGTIAERINVTGTLEPRQEVFVSPQIGDLAVVELLAEEGDHVEADQVLARLARDQLDASLAQNTAAIARAQAAISQAQAGVLESEASRLQASQALARTRTLETGGNASHEALEQRQATAATAAARVEAAQSALRSAAADLAMAEAQRRELLVRLARTDIRAPVDGIVSRRTARLGAVVTSGGEPLFRITGHGSIELDADVPEVLLAKLRPGQPAVIRTASGPRQGSVRLVAAEVNRTTRLGSVRIAVDGQGGLIIGSFARAEVEIARRDGVILPLAAVQFQSDGPVVQVVENDRVRTRHVSLGLRDNGRIEIASGVRDGEAVVAVAGTFVRDGDRVRPIAATGS